MKLVSSAMLCLICLSTTAARAQDVFSSSTTAESGSAMVFGDKGTYVLGGTTGVGIGGMYQQLDAYKKNSLNIDAGLLFGSFVSRNILLGVEGAVKTRLFNDAGDEAATTIGPMIGLNMPMHGYSSFLPTLAFVYDYSYGKSYDVPLFAGTLHNHALAFDINLAFAMKLTPHISILVGPYVKQSVYHVVRNAHSSDTVDTLLGTTTKSTYDTNYGIRVSVLGWL